MSLREAPYSWGAGNFNTAQKLSAWGNSQKNSIALPTKPNVVGDGKSESHWGQRTDVKWNSTKKSDPKNGWNKNNKSHLNQNQNEKKEVPKIEQNEEPTKSNWGNSVNANKSQWNSNTSGQGWGSKPNTNPNFNKPSPFGKQTTKQSSKEEKNDSTNNENIKLEINQNSSKEEKNDSTNNENKDEKETHEPEEKGEKAVSPNNNNWGGNYQNYKTGWNDNKNDKQGWENMGTKGREERIKNTNEAQKNKSNTSNTGKWGSGTKNKKEDGQSWGSKKEEKKEKATKRTTFSLPPSTNIRQSPGTWTGNTNNQNKLNSGTYYTSNSNSEGKYILKKERDVKFIKDIYIPKEYTDFIDTLEMIDSVTRESEEKTISSIITYISNNLSDCKFFYRYIAYVSIIRPLHWSSLANLINSLHALYEDDVSYQYIKTINSYFYNYLQAPKNNYNKIVQAIVDGDIKTVLEYFENPSTTFDDTYDIIRGDYSRLNYANIAALAGNYNLFMFFTLNGVRADLTYAIMGGNIGIYQCVYNYSKGSTTFTKENLNKVKTAINYHRNDFLDYFFSTESFISLSWDLINSFNIKYTLFLYQNHYDINTEKIITKYASFGGYDLLKLIEKENIYMFKNVEKNAVMFNESLKTMSIKTVGFFLDRGVDINAVDENKETALCFAVKSNSLELIKYLIKRGAKVNDYDRNNNSLLYIATEKEDIQMAKVLVENGADPNFRFFQDSKLTPLQKAALDDSHEIFSMLLKHVNINQYIDHGLTVLHQLCQYNVKPEYIQEAIDCGADVNMDAQNTYRVAERIQENDILFYKNLTPLYYAIASKSLQNVKTLIENGANINAEISPKINPVYFSIIFSSLEILKYFVEEKGFSLSLNDLGYSTIHLAAQFGSVEILEYVIESGFDINEMFNEEPPIYAAIKQYNEQNALLLIDKECNIDYINNEGKNLLIVAMNNKLTGAQRKLASNGLSYR